MPKGKGDIVRCSPPQSRHSPKAKGDIAESRPTCLKPRITCSSGVPFSAAHRHNFATVRKQKGTLRGRVRVASRHQSHVAAVSPFPLLTATISPQSKSKRGHCGVASELPQATNHMYQRCPLLRCSPPKSRYHRHPFHKPLTHFSKRSGDNELDEACRFFHHHGAVVCTLLRQSLRR